MQKSRIFLLISLSLAAAACGQSSADVLLAPSAAPSEGPPPDTDYLQTKTSGYGFTQIQTAHNNPIIALRTIMMVPPLPTDSGTLFFSVGLQPGGQNFDPIDNGVLEAVLSWGPSCAPNSPNAPFTSWWISAQYVNTYGNVAGYTGCHGGDGLFVEVGDPLSIHFSLDGTVWHQSVENLRDGASVGFDLDLLGQAQNYAHFWLNPVSAEPIADGEFASTTVTFANAEPDACSPIQRGRNDFFSNPEPSADGTQCSIDRIVLRAEGVPASTQN